jgi:hypothetical protein
MTERVMPAIALPSPARRRHLREGVARPVVRPARPTVQRKEAVLNAPTRAGMLIGVSAAVYAVTLAGVSVLQADSEAALSARRQPYVEALAAARSANDSLEASLLKVEAGARALAADYAAVGEDIAGYQARLDELAALVAEVQGTAAALPTRISLPAVTVRSAGSSGGGSSKAPAAKATTRASGAP